MNRGLHHVIVCARAAIPRLPLLNGAKSSSTVPRLGVPDLDAFGVEGFGVVLVGSCRPAKVTCSCWAFQPLEVAKVLHGHTIRFV